MKKYNNLIIDCNNLYARAFYVCKQKTQKMPDVINQTIQLSLKMILNLQHKFLEGDGSIYVLADNPTSKITMRKELSGGEYKADRMKETDGYYRGIDYLLVILNNYSSTFKTVRIKHLEADDLVPSILENCIGNSLLISTDMDWARSISISVDWYNIKEIYDVEKFTKHFKFYPTVNSITLYKSLLGDVSDNIQGIKNLTNQVALNIIKYYTDVFDLINSVKKNDEKSYSLSEHTKKLILSNERKLVINHNIIYFCEVDKTEIKTSIIKGAFNPKALSILYKSMDFPNNFDSRIEEKKQSFGDIFSNFSQIDRK